MTSSVPTQPILSGLPHRNGLNGLPLGLFRLYTSLCASTETAQGSFATFPSRLLDATFRKLKGALLRAFGDLYAPSLEGVYISISMCH